MHDDEARGMVQQSINLFSRVIAVLILVVLPGIGGVLLDRRLGGHFLAPIGFGLGMMIGIIGLWLLIKRAAQGMPIPKRPFNEIPDLFQDAEQDDDDADSQSRQI